MRNRLSWRAGREGSCCGRFPGQVASCSTRHPGALQVLQAELWSWAPVSTECSRDHGILYFLLLVSFTNGNRRPFPESYDCPRVSTWASQLLRASGQPSGTVGLKWPQPSGQGQVMATKKLQLQQSFAPDLPPLCLWLRQILLFPSLEMPKACPCQSH